MIPTESKNTIHFRQTLLPYCWLHDLEILTVNGGESTSQYHTLLVVAKFTGKQKKIQSGYFIATPRIYLAEWINIQYTAIVIGVTGNANLSVTLLV
jgi:hypothetical protein